MYLAKFCPTDGVWGNKTDSCCKFLSEGMVNNSKAGITTHKYDKDKGHGSDNDYQKVEMAPKSKSKRPVNITADSEW
ncbi:hypothetical protein MAR_033567 [Mya arenaria]|uniref:Uncharacterized protein n=1 Tax=Mya arenaria TaxID=6604 RepID=A0ABY7G9F0_MYAAR|nr:hypothetical protein MAR_033567 [Mya arenaria]